jgi:hypothetical protein
MTSRGDSPLSVRQSSVKVISAMIGSELACWAARTASCSSLTKRSARIPECDLANRPELLANGADGASQKDWQTGLLTRLSSDLDRPEVDLTSLVIKPVLSKLVSIGPVRVRLDYFSARKYVFAVNPLHELRLTQAQLVEAPLVRDAASVQSCAHCAIAKHCATSDTF